MSAPLGGMGGGVKGWSHTCCNARRDGEMLGAPLVRGCMQQIIIDANIALHFKRVDEIDWLHLANASEAKLLVVPQLMTELERKKVHASSGVIRKRAAGFIDYLVAKMDLPDPIEIRPSVFLCFHTFEPILDFESENLAPDIDDDRYIASAIELARQNEGDIWIASQDGGMALKLRSRPVKLLRIPPKYSLPEEVDEETKELRKAKQELDRIKLARPALALEFKNGEKIWSQALLKEIPFQGPTTQEIAEEYELTPRPIFKKPSQPSLEDFARSAYRDTLASWEMSARARDAYLAEYEQYLRAEATWLDKLCRVYEVQLNLENSGAASATHVDVALSLPADTSALEWSDFDKRPEPPERPRARSWMDRISEPLIYPNMDFRHNLAMPSDGDVYIDEAGKEATFEIKVMKPKSTVSLEKFCIYLAPEMVGKTFTLNAKIQFAEAEPVLAQLPIRTHITTDSRELGE